MAEALASNIGGAATLVGDPPNIIIASRAPGPDVHRLSGPHAAVVLVVPAGRVLIRFVSCSAKPCRNR